MAGPFDLTGQNIEDSYQRVLQTPDGVNIYDGTGSLFTVTAVAAPAGPDQSIQFRDGVSTSGSGNFTFNKIDNIVNLTGSLVANSFTGSLLGTASWAQSASQAISASYYQETDPIFTAKSASLATTGSNIFVGNQVVSGSFIIETASSAAALRITQLGAGEAIRVEDNTTPDSTAFIVDSSGSVGIGLFTSSLTLAAPLYPLHVIAPSGVDARMVFDGKQLGNGAANANITIAADTNDKVASFDFLDRNGVAYNGTATYTGPTVKFLLDRSGSSAPLATGGRRNDFYIVNGFADRAIIFHTSASDGNLSANVPGRPRLTITGSNVGIGTTTPRTILHVISGSSSGASIQTYDTAVFESNANTYVSIYSPTASNAAVQFGSGGTGGDALGAYIRWNQGNNLMTLGTANDGDNINFVTGNETSSMYLKNNIGLGIGTTDPRYKLHVRNGAVTDSSTFGGSVGVFENSGSNAFVSILSHTGYSSGVGFGSNVHRSSARLAWTHDSLNFSLSTNTGSAFLTFGTGQAVERMRITTDGLVGIGTTTPQYLLDVSGSARVTSSLYLPGLTTTVQNNVVTVDITTGQLYYTASTAFGGGSSTPAFPYTGSAIISGSLIVTGSLNTQGYISSYKTTSSQETFSSASYVAGDIIQGTVDGGVSQYNLAYLDIDGIWKNVDQTASTSTKMLGIYIGGSQILLDGHISANTNGVGITIGPGIQNPNDGLPVYIDPGPSSQFNTTIPTSNYIRTLGYLYYNNTITSNYWILKFRPSTDWYKI